MIKFDNALSKKYEKQLENFSEEELRKLEELNELFEFLDDIIPLEDEEDDPPKKGRKRYGPFSFSQHHSLIKQCRIPTLGPQYRRSLPCRRSMSVATTTTTTSATSGDRSPPPSPRVKSKAKCVFGTLCPGSAQAAGMAACR